MNPFYILLIIFSSALVPYLLGSIDFAIIVCKIVAGKDIRDYGCLLYTSDAADE